MRRKTTSKTSSATTSKPARAGVTVSVIVLLAALLLSTGVAGGFLLTRSRIPQSLESSTPAGSMTVASTRFDDSRSVQLTLALGASATVTSPVSGTVTSSDCATNATVASGSTPIAVDAVPLLALNTATPPYRRLASGTQGPDARALNDALRALGYAAPDSDWFVWDSIVAYNTLAGDVGARRITKNDGWAIDPSFFIWLPAATVTVADCRIAVGRQATQGADLFATSGAPVKATLPASQSGAQSASQSASTQSSGAVAGDRILTVNGQDFPVAAGTTELTDAAVLAAIAASTEYRLASLGGGSGGGGSGAAGTSTGGGTGTGEGGTLQVSFTWRLANPIESITVPPSALYRTSGGTACVSVKGEPTPVTIIASQLGKTMVSPDGVDPFTTVDVAPTTSKPCRE
ncbi:hypothetical protein [Bifidobacterium parmae]|uniref:ABC transporter n=1 Tax=Bifidobacterium parmae TaxID=361854 RepID=A0A2N5J5X0_9BIFI|nr:hypothetical protein [Bifidobacterium parmae]PLS29596.1 ABC transporter [Bifidobacterium parmae]